jgi:hypothetical protein
MILPSVPFPTGTAHHAVAELLLDLESQSLFREPRLAAVLQDQRVVDLGHRLA